MEQEKRSNHLLRNGIDHSKHNLSMVENKDELGCFSSKYSDQTLPQLPPNPSPAARPVAFNAVLTALPPPTTLGPPSIGTLSPTSTTVRARTVTDQHPITSFSASSTAFPPTVLPPSIAQILWVSLIVLIGAFFSAATSIGNALVMVSTVQVQPSDPLSPFMRSDLNLCGQKVADHLKLLSFLAGSC